MSGRKKGGRDKKWNRRKKRKEVMKGEGDDGRKKEIRQKERRKNEGWRVNRTTKKAIISKCKEERKDRIK